MPICKTRDWCTVSEFSSTFLDVPSGAFPDSRPACIPNPNRFLLSYQVRARGTCDLLGQGCWQSLFSAPRLLFPLCRTETCRRPQLPKPALSRPFPYPFWDQHRCPSRCAHLLPYCPLTPFLLYPSSSDTAGRCVGRGGGDGIGLKHFPLSLEQISMAGRRSIA